LFSLLHVSDTVFHGQAASRIPHAPGLSHAISSQISAAEARYRLIFFSRHDTAALSGCLQSLAASPRLRYWLFFSLRRYGNSQDMSACAAGALPRFRHWPFLSLMPGH
jgi:hypothetical protein